MESILVSYELCDLVLFLKPLGKYHFPCKVLRIRLDTRNYTSSTYLLIMLVPRNRNPFYLYTLLIFFNVLPHSLALESQRSLVSKARIIPTLQMQR